MAESSGDAAHEGNETKDSNHPLSVACLPPLTVLAGSAELLQQTTMNGSGGFGSSSQFVRETQARPGDSKVTQT